MSSPPHKPKALPAITQGPPIENFLETVLGKL